jgi:hypothetical protein
VSEPIVLPPLGDPVDELWDVLLDLGERLTLPWALIGGQMVLLHAIEHGTVPPQVSQDGDVLANIRAAPDGLARVVAELEALGFTLAGFAPDGIAHRYIRPSRHPERPVMIDVLAPEGVGGRANLTTTPPGRTVQVPGGTQALARTEQVTVKTATRVGTVPRPTLLAAVVGKAVACDLPGDPSRHLRDLALLCALVDDPFATAAELDRTDRRRLRCADDLDDPNHPAWLLVPEHLRDEGRIAWATLNELPAS